MLHVFYHTKNKIWKKEKIPHQNSWDAANAGHGEKFKAQIILEKQIFNSIILVSPLRNYKGKRQIKPKESRKKNNEVKSRNQ